MHSTEGSNKKQLQEVQYRLPYHWMLKGSAIPVYNSRHRLLVAMIKNLPGNKEKALDLGCGDGKNTYELQKSFEGIISFSGIDFSENAIGFAKLIAPSIDFRVQDASKIDFPDNAFDLLVCIEVIEHIPPGKMDIFLKEVNRVLKPGAGVLFTTPSINLPLNDKHYQHFTEVSLTELLKQAGFKVHEVKGFGMTLPATVNKIYKYLLSVPGLWRLAASVGGRVLPWEKANTILVSAIKNKEA